MGWVKHRMSHTRLYRVWDGMISRCHREKYHSYKRYGGRGITVCDEWRNDFHAFYEWAIRNGYHEGLSIDRIDNDKGYSPDNCRWVTMKVQGNNKRSNHYIEYNGETHTIAEWSEILGIPRNVLYHRFERGWSVKRAFETVKRAKGPDCYIEFFGERHTPSEWSKILGIPYSTLRYRIESGWPLEKAFKPVGGQHDRKLR